MEGFLVMRFVGDCWFFSWERVSWGWISHSWVILDDYVIFIVGCCV